MARGEEVAELVDTRVFILAGGLGTRLAHITKNLPKPMARVAGRPFLEWQIEGFKDQGFLDFVFLVGHKREAIQDHFLDGSRFGVRVQYSIEDELLGTGGAFLKALGDFPCRTFVLANGDTYFNVSLKSLLGEVGRHSDRVYIALKHLDEMSRYGAVVVSAEWKIEAFLEKNPMTGSSYINGGVYAGRPSQFARFDIGRSSMETDVFPKLIRQEALFGFPFEVPFIDIGVPEDFTKAQALLPLWNTQK